MRRRLKWGLALALAASTPISADQRADGAVAYEISDGRLIDTSLTGRPGDATAGRALYFDDEATGCIECHGAPGSTAAPSATGPRSGPALGDVGARLEVGEIRLWIVAPEVHAPQTRMPAYFAPNQRRDANDPRFGGPRLSAREIEDLVAYLATLGAE